MTKEWANKSFGVALGILLAILIVFFSYQVFLYLKNRSTDVENSFTEETIKIQIGSAKYDLLVADAYDERVQGLSDRTELDSDGMLFIFDELDRHGIWMKDMHMNLDIYWLDSSKQIIYAQYDVTPKSFPFVFKPVDMALYVVEMPANNEDLKIGDVVNFI